MEAVRLVASTTYPTVDLVDQRGNAVRVPLWIMPGQPDNVITIYLGFGRSY